MRIKQILWAALLFCGPASVAQNQAYDMMIDGVKVIVQPSGNNIVEIRTILKGGVQNYPATKAGIEALAMSALTECGTLSLDKNAFKNKLDKVSAQVYGYTGKNYATYTMNCVKSDFQTVWPLYAEALTKPRFDPKEFDRIKQDAVTNLMAAESQPDVSIDKYAEKVAFAGRDYAKDPEGTAAIVKSLTVDEVKAYYPSILSRSRMLVVVVADLPRTEIESKVKAMLADIKPGAPFALKKSSYRIYKNAFTSTQKELATNYIEGITGGPQPGAADFNAFSVAMRIFADMHFLEVRTNNGLSYAPQSWFDVGTLSTARVAVSTTEPDKYIAVFDKLVDQLRTKGFAADQVKNMKTEYLNSLYYKQETNSAQAGSLAADEVLHANWRRSLTLADDVSKLTLDQVNQAFRAYIGNTSWVYQGNPTKVTALNFINGTIKRNANPTSR